jgi:hypothetical protein
VRDMHRRTTTSKTDRQERALQLRVTPHQQTFHLRGKKGWRLRACFSAHAVHTCLFFFFPLYPQMLLCFIVVWFCFLCLFCCHCELASAKAFVADVRLRSAHFRLGTPSMQCKLHLRLSFSLTLCVGSLADSSALWTSKYVCAREKKRAGCGSRRKERQKKGIPSRTRASCEKAEVGEAQKRTSADRR